MSVVYPGVSRRTAGEKPWAEEAPPPIRDSVLDRAERSGSIRLAGFLAGTQHQLDQSQAANRAVAAVLAAPDAQIATSSTTVGGTVTAVISASDREAVVTTAGMPDPAGNRVYQLWVMSAAGARSAGLMGGSPGGASLPVLASGIQPGERLGITVEPAGGSSKPTTTPIVVIAAHA
jgi:anti-sigma-K factor RskA